MAFDAFFLTAVLEEVRQKCTGARVDKIHQPSRDTLILHLPGRDSREKLLFAAHVLYAAAQAPFGGTVDGNFPTPHGAGGGVHLRLHR